MTNQPTIEDLIVMVNDTYLVDETGDANLLDWLNETDKTLLAGMSLREALTNYLQWSNGPGLAPKEE